MSDRAVDLERQLLERDPFARLGLPTGGEGLTTSQLTFARRQLEGEVHQGIPDATTRNRVLDLIAQAHAAAANELTGPSGTTYVGDRHDGANQIAAPPIPTSTVQSARPPKPMRIALVVALCLGATVIGVLLLNVDSNRGSSDARWTSNGGSASGGNASSREIDVMNFIPKNASEKIQLAEEALRLANADPPPKNQAALFRLAGTHFSEAAATERDSTRRDQLNSQGARAFLEGAQWFSSEGQAADAWQLAYMARSCAVPGSPEASFAEDLLAAMERD